MAWLLLLVFLSLLLYLLFAAVVLEIDSRTGLCRLKFHRLASARIYMSNAVLMLEWKAVLWSGNIMLFSQKQPGAGSRKKEQKKDRKKTHRQMPSPRLLLALLKTFKVNKCYLAVDTGDVVLNSRLFPCLYFFQAATGRAVSINFLNQNIIVLNISNNMARLLGAFIKYRLFNRK